LNQFSSNLFIDNHTASWIEKQKAYPPILQQVGFTIFFTFS